MSDLIIHYKDLDRMTEELQKVASEATEYMNEMASSIILPINQLTGGSSSYVTEARDLVKQKIRELINKADRSRGFAEQIGDLNQLAYDIDKEVEKLIAENGQDFLNHHESFKVTEWQETITGWLVELKNKFPILEDIANATEGICDKIEHAGDEIKNWYYCQGGREFCQALGETLELFVSVGVAIVISVFFPPAGAAAWVMVLGESMFVIDQCSNIEYKWNAYHAIKNENPGLARHYSRVDNFSDELRQRNYGNTTMNELSYLFASEWQELSIINTAYNLANGAGDVSTCIDDKLSSKNYFRGSDGKFSGSVLKDEIKNTYKGFKASVNEIFKGGAVDDIIEDASKLADAKTAAVDMDKVDDTIDSLKAANRLDDIEGGLNSITVKEERLIHSTVGEFNSNGRLINGGHGQSNIDYLEANGIPYNIVKEYPNGVRVGNIPSHKNKFKRTGIGQAWFPKSWSDADIKNAGEFVANLSKNAEVPDGVWRFDEYNGVRVGVIKNDGEIGTIIPDNSRQP